VAKGLKVPCLFMITEVSIRYQKNPGGWYTPYTRVYPPIHHWLGPRSRKPCPQIKIYHYTPGPMAIVNMQRNFVKLGFVVLEICGY